MQIWFLIEVATLALSVPVFALEYYWVFLLGNSLRYPRSLASGEVQLKEHPVVSVIIATYNEKFVIGRSLDAMKNLNYPKDRLQVVVADDSSDQTVDLIDEKVRELNLAGIKAVVSRRSNREFFKCGALNKAMEYVVGDYVLLLDADSVVLPDTIIKGIDAMEKHPRTSFVSYRYGHYNRDHNLVTQLFALNQDIGDTLSKMGAYKVNAPFSYQGGLALVRTKDLREVGLWTNQRIADDTDISIKMYLAGKRGIYLSNVSVMSEDPSTLEAWKKQVARTSQGWWRCIGQYWKTIITAKDVSVRKKLGLILMLMAPFTSLSWIVVTFLSGLTVVFGLVPASNSLFNSPVYVAAVSVPIALSMASGAWALWVQGLMTARNVVLIPMLGYATGCMMTLGSIGFFYGVFDRMGFFWYRTPKSGSGEYTKSAYFRSLTNDRNAVVELVLALAGLVLALFVLLDGVWFLSLSLAGFGIFTLKSMNLTRKATLKE
jgi:cellulose synthase/poly-beta-1,6-N-acetylglucosamine synthase-like glycosyltransferase